jgi:hypothetical protein
MTYRTLSTFCERPFLFLSEPILRLLNGLLVQKSSFNASDLHTHERFSRYEFTWGDFCLKAHHDSSLIIFYENLLRHPQIYRLVIKHTRLVITLATFHTHNRPLLPVLSAFDSDGFQCGLPS